MPKASLDWSEIQSVLLDMDGTLLDLKFDNWFWQDLLPTRWGEREGLGADDAKAALRPLFRQHEGTLNWYCLDHWSRELDLDVAALKREVEHEIRVHPHVTDFLDAVRALGKRVVLVTNAHHGALEVKLRTTGIGGHFDAVHSSHDYGAPKEHADFWGRLAARERFARGHTLFVDDSLPVLHAARAYGIAHLVCVTKPASDRPARTVADYPCIEDFSEITPPRQRAGGPSS